MSSEYLKIKLEKPLVKNLIQYKELMLLQQQEELEEEYKNKICCKCIGTEQQQKRNCSILKGGFLCCSQMEYYCHKRLKKEKEKIFKTTVAVQVEQAVELHYEIVDVE